MAAVHWSPSATNDLAKVWVEATDRDAVTNAVARIEGAIARNPLDVGESREGIQRLTFDGPLAVLFLTETDGRQATIVGLWNIE